MTFGKALKKLKKGHSLARYGWEPDQYVYLMQGWETNPGSSDSVYFLPSFYIRERSTVSPYVPWDEDLLEEDWYVVGAKEDDSTKGN